MAANSYALLDSASACTVHLNAAGPTVTLSAGWNATAEGIFGTVATSGNVVPAGASTFFPWSSVLFVSGT